MPVNSFIIQPSANALRAAYRPVVLKVLATATGGGLQPPYVSCDVYINNTYYKSIIRTVPDSIGDTGSVYIFDIQTALQEYLAIDLAPVDNQDVLKSSHSSAKVFCRFRSSDIVDSFTVEEGTKPIQGTKFTDPVAGDGFESNAFFVINSALQHEDNQDLTTHLNAFKQGTWADDAFPLTHRKHYFFCETDSDHFPFIYKGECIEADLKILYRNKREIDINTAQVSGGAACEAIGFTTDVAGNTVNVALDNAPAAGTYVKVQIKLHADSVWTDKGNFTAQNFSFTVGVMGNYDIRVITFCSACISATPETGTFTIVVEATLAWRGINPFCVQQTFESPIYVVLENRNAVTTDTNFPNDDHPFSARHETKVDLYAKFFSDATHLTPLDLTQDGLKIYIKKRVATVENSSISRTVESLVPYTVDVAGTEVLLESDVLTVQNITNYSPYPTVSGTSNSSFTYSVYPTHLLVGGNTGYKGFSDLQEYNTTTNVPTGTTKPNIDSDPDYIEPVADGITCNPGPPYAQAVYAAKLEVSKLEFNSGTSVFAETVSDTQTGGYTFLVSTPANTDTNITVKARTRDTGNTTGIVKAAVTYVSGGVAVTTNFSIPDNVETTLPQVFQNILLVVISNF